MVPRESRICIKRVLWGKAARATRVVSSGMATRGWRGSDILLSLHHIATHCILPADSHWTAYLPSRGYQWHRGNMTAYRLSSSIGILTALQGIIFLYDSVWVIELGNSIYCGAKNCVGYIVDARYWEVIKHA